MGKICLLCVILFTSLFAFTDSASEVNDTLTILSDRVSQLELELDQLKRDRALNPISSGAYQKWGVGLYTAVEYPYFSTEIGYSLSVIPNVLHLGLAGGYARKPEGIEQPVSMDYYHGGENNLYWKIFASSPVFFNLMSFSGSLSQLYALGKIEPSQDTLLAQLGKTGGEQSVSVISAQAEFWLSSRVQFYCGMNAYLNYFRDSNSSYKSSESISWSTNSFKIGSRFWFGQFRDMGKSRSRGN